MLASRGTTSAAADDRLAGSVALPYLLCIAQAAHVIFVAQITVDHDIRQPPPPPPPGWVWEYWKITSWPTCLVSHFPHSAEATRRAGWTRWLIPSSV